MRTERWEVEIVHDSGEWMTVELGDELDEDEETLTIDQVIQIIKDGLHFTVKYLGVDE